MRRNVGTAFLRTSGGWPQQTISTAVRYNTPASSSFHSSTHKAAVAHPITAHGPPPKAPSPTPEFGELPPQQTDPEETGRGGTSQRRPIKKPTALKKRFWKNVDVQRKQGGDYQVLLDARPVRTPSKSVLSIPSTKPYLAHAIALEWDVMNSAQQALKNHLIPLTSLTARAADIMQEDVAGETTVRDQIVKTAMRYLETDTLLCWVPERSEFPAEDVDENGQKRETLREAQMRVASDIIAFLSTKVWPGIDIVPVLDSDSILPVSQSQATKDIIQQWVRGLEAHDLSALERGILASKSLLVAVRLVAEWSENFRHLQRPGHNKFGIEEAAEASSLEVRWQTDMWGEVEDTHDVDKEDLKRQLGSVIVLVSGETR
ncbi:ATP synthase complex assembly protein ATP12 [Aspergillus lucknowensis]|uniref:ATP12-domain-containing protein n=1 Tax=Aspergillus lucknowensis TaxID=176173 RepID=A0ABR4LK05_9EURO